MAKTESYDRFLKESVEGRLLRGVIHGFADRDLSRRDILDELTALQPHISVPGLRKIAERYSMLLQEMEHEDSEHPKLSEDQMRSLDQNRRIGELIFQLRDEFGLPPYGYDRGVNFWSWQWPGSWWGEAWRHPAILLIREGLAAVPALIEEIGDERPARGTVANGSEILPSTIGDLAVTILEAIANRSFFSKATNRPPGEDDPAKIANSVRLWWRSMNEKGEKQTLIDTVLSDDENRESAAGDLVRKYPTDAVAAIAPALERTHDQRIRIRLIQLLISTKQPSAYPALRRIVVSSGDDEERLAAAEGLPPDDVSDPIHRMIGLLMSEKPVPDRWNGREMIARIGLYLDRMSSTEGIEAIEKRLPELGVETRLRILAGPWAGLPRREPSDLYLSSLEAMLVQELDDTEPNGSNWEPSFSHSLRPCDLAGKRLAEGFPARGYRFTPFPDSYRLERQRIENLNVFRTRTGETPLIPPNPPSAPSPSTVDIRSLIRRFLGPLRADDSEIALARIRQLGVAALPAVSQAASREAAGSMSQWRLLKLRNELGNWVRDVAFQGTADGGAQIRARALSLKGQILTARTLGGLLDACDEFRDSKITKISLVAERDTAALGIELRVGFYTGPLDSYLSNTSIWVDGHQLNGTGFSTSGRHPSDFISSELKRALSSNPSARLWIECEIPTVKRR